MSRQHLGDRWCVVCVEVCYNNCYGCCGCYYFIVTADTFKLVVLVCRQTSHYCCIICHIATLFYLCCHIMLFRLPVGIMWSGICGFLWLHVWQQPDASVVPFYQSSVYWFCISSFVEILVQPIAVVGQILLFVEVKVQFLTIIETKQEQIYFYSLLYEYE